jgi:hypothetical protein
VCCVVRRSCLDPLFVALVALECAQYCVKRVKKQGKHTIIYSLVGVCSSLNKNLKNFV